MGLPDSLFPFAIPSEIFMKNLFLLGAGLMAPALAAFAEIKDMDDAQIADVVITANQIAIEAGKLVSTRSSDENVKAYARRMIDEHSDVNKSANELAVRLNLIPRNNPISVELQAEKKIAALESLKGQAFDKAYIDQKVAFHQDILDTIDNRLMPNAANEDLKTLLYGLFSPLSEHLEHAQQIQESLNRSPRDKAVH
jgi:putative membrane protein